MWTLTSHTCTTVCNLWSWSNPVIHVWYSYLWHTCMGQISQNKLCLKISPIISTQIFLSSYGKNLIIVISDFVFSRNMACLLDFLHCIKRVSMLYWMRCFLSTIICWWADYLNCPCSSCFEYRVHCVCEWNNALQSRGYLNRPVLVFWTSRCDWSSVVSTCDIDFHCDISVIHVRT